MNVLFLTLCEYDSIFERDLYTDLLRVFMNKGSHVYMVSPVERRRNKKTYVIQEKNSTIVRQRIGNIQKTNTLEKGISTVLLGLHFKRAIKVYLSDVHFDLILYSTPPITMVNAIKYVKKRDHAKTYLQLKDIFPQNAVDIGLLSDKGLKGVLLRFFKREEKKLYRVSDRIGCMSPANVEYLIRQNPEINPEIVEVCPNSIELTDKSADLQDREKIRDKYGIPQDKIVFIYGGNLGKPQGVPFIIDCLKAVERINEAFFLVVGDGTDFELLETYYKNSNQSNFKIMKHLPKSDYDTMVGACDVGMIFLDHRFTIPNYPSRIISYMQAKKPVLACTDPVSDIGKTIIEGDFGWWCESNDINGFIRCVYSALHANLLEKGENAWRSLCSQFDVQDSYNLILHFMNRV